MTARSRAAIGALLTLAVVFLSLGPALVPTPVAAQSSAPSFTSTPATLDVSVALGTTRTVPLRLNNGGTAPGTPRLFEALPPTAQVASPAAPARVPLPTPHTRAPGEEALVDPQIAADQAADPAGEALFLVFLTDQADLTAAYGITDWAARGEFVYRTLSAHAAQSQQNLRAAIEAQGLTYTPLWIVNALAVRGDAVAVQTLATQSAVAELRAVRVAELGAPPLAPPAQPSTFACQAGPDNVCWNIARVGASRVWDDFGVRGEGVTVASLDSGVRFDHPALVGQYRGSSGGTVSHDYNWYDAYGASLAPVDSGNHGTHTMGTIVARGRSATQPAVGVAPGSRWIAVRTCSARECSELDLILGAQWLLAPTNVQGENPRPDLRPHIVNNSWTAGQSANWYAGYVAAWRAAGLYPVFAAGNTGGAPNCGTIQSPGDFANVTAVGATDTADRRTSFSSIGPTADGRIKPDLTAPGNGILSTVADTRVYGSLSGTSMATPHVAGAAALLWSANPELIGNYEATYALLTTSALPITGDSRYQGDNYAACRPDLVPNNIYGYGRLDVYKAVARATVDVPWLGLPTDGVVELAPGAGALVDVTFDARQVPGPGIYTARILVHSSDLSFAPLVVPVTLTVAAQERAAVVEGRVTRAADGLPLTATVRVAGGAEVLTNATGAYSVTLLATTEPYTITATARDYAPTTATVTLEPGQRLTLDFALEANLPRLRADMSPRTVDLSMGKSVMLSLPISNEGSQPLSYTLSLPTEDYGVWRSDESDGPPAAWRDPPAEAVTVNLTDDGASGPIPIGFGFPFYNRLYERLYISANGVITFTPLPAAGITFTSTCLPVTETPGAAIVPLRVDLDPSKAGARVSYSALPEGFLVSWENVPLYNDAQKRLSFQALLQPDGRVRMNYKRVADVSASDSPSVGIQGDLDRVQSLGCKSTLSLTDGLTIELRPQIPSSEWLTIEQQGGNLQAGESAAVRVRLRWVPPASGGWPASGVVELRTNDPTNQRAHFTVRLRTTPAPYIYYWPRLDG